MTPDLFASAIRIATPLALAAIGGTISERSGIVNIALEGMMLFGAFMAVTGTWLTGNPWIGVLTATLAGASLAAIHAFACITLRTDHVVSGTAINILAAGLTGFLIEYIYGHPGTTDSVQRLTPVFSIEGPTEGVLGTIWYWFNTIFLSYTPIIYMAIFFAIFGQWALFHTRWGLRLRSLGEHPRAADTVGINVHAGRYVATIMSGMLGGLAGANLTLEQVGSFTEGMTNGRGFIALAANIFGRWTPLGSYMAALLFGFADALQIKLQLLRDVITIPSQFFLMLPYVLTVVVLAGVVGRAVPPAAIGKHYIKE